MNKKEWDKVSKNYFNNIEVSPFSKGVINPLLKDIKAIDKDKITLDLGTGIGSLIPHLKNFKKVYATDFSKGMIKKAKELHNAKNISFLVKDSTNLKEFHKKIDITFAINSLVDPSIKNTQKMFQEIGKTTKETFYGIFPAMESELFRALLTIEKELKAKNEKTAIKNTHQILRSNEFDYLLAIYKKEKQKAFYQFEIEYYLKNAGFKSIEFKKVLYPWTTWDINDLKYFSKKPKLWDWYVIAKKRKKKLR